MSSYQRPLAVYVVWHAKNSKSKSQADTLAERLYAHLNHDESNPWSRVLGVPVYFSRSVPGPAGWNIPLGNNPDAAQRTAVVVLVDDEMLLERASWGPAIRSLWDACQAAGDMHRCFLVGLSDSTYKLDSKLAEVQFIRVNKSNPTMHVLNRVTHELCRLMYGQCNLADDVNARVRSPSVGVFLSHAKKDGLPITEGVRDYIGKHLALRSFFDARDILPSTLWKDELGENARNSALLAIQTDAYATREWCQFEVLEAKKAGVPIVVVNAVQAREARGFPYLGNVPTIRWRPHGDTWYEEVLGLLFWEVLHGKYFPARVEALLNLHGIQAKPRTLPYAPELLTALPFPPNSTIVYPDPPLASRELHLLNELNRGFQFATPSTLTELS